MSKVSILKAVREKQSANFSTETFAGQKGVAKYIFEVLKEKNL